MVEDVSHERTLILLLSITDAGILKQSKFSDHGIKVLENLALEQLHRQRLEEKYVAVSLIE